MYYTIKAKLPYENDLDYFNSFISAIKSIIDVPIEISGFKYYGTVEINNISRDIVSEISKLPLVYSIKESPADRMMVSDDQRIYV